MAAKKKKTKLFNDRKRKIFRNYISSGELGFGVFFVVFVALMGIWFFTRADKYDPSERDISMEVLIEQQVEDNLYKAPLKRWVDPSNVAMASVVTGPDLGVIPPQVLSNGWVDSSRLQEFDWDTLYEKINGAEVQYKSYGFERAYFLGISNEAASLEMNIEIYDQGSFTNALGIFWAQRNPGTQLTHEGNAHYYLTDVGAIGIVDKYFFKLTGDQSDPQIVDHAKLFVETFESTVTVDAEAPAMFTKLREEFPFESIGYIKEDVFQYDFCEEFWFAKPDPAADLRYFVHEAESVEAAASLFGDFAEEQSYEYEEVSREENSVVFKHEFLDTFFVLNTNDAVVYGIDSAPDADSATRALGELEELLFGNV